jgi:hypothetical protein
MAGAAVAGLALGTTAANAGTVGELGILDTSGNNPATGEPWAVGDAYHLTYVTTGTTEATSTDIADYNSFVQSEAGTETVNGTNLGDASWSALGSTSTTDAIDNVDVTGPVINIANNGTFAVDAPDLWDFTFGSNNPLSTLGGSDMNVWTGTDPGGTANGGSPLGAGTVRRHWSGWTNWGPAFATSSNTEGFPMAAVSEPLEVVPTPAGASMGLVGMLALGGSMLATRRRPAQDTAQ